MPAIFFGHGNPMNALRQNRYTQAWAAIGAQMPRPKAVLAISAHWYIRDSAVTSMAAPPTIHDFGGFPPALHEYRYPAGGAPELASRIQQLLQPVAVASDDQWGLDHGTWSVLCHVFPDADIPVVQLSIDMRQPARFHFDIGKALVPLRDQGILIMGSGNIVHNLRSYMWQQPDLEPYDWARRFEERIRQYLSDDDAASLLDYERLGNDARMSAPTPEHFLPLIYIMGTRQPGDRIDFPIAGFDGGAISMLAVRLS